MNAVIWGYKYKDMKESWKNQMNWLFNSLQDNKIDVYKHPDFICKGLENSLMYNHKENKSYDICIYNHADCSHLVGANILKVKRNWFFKPTVPEEGYTTLDELGYGPYSSISYKKPDFLKVEKEKVDLFFNTKVKSWIENKNNKWGSRYNLESINIEEKDYILILGQCFGDEVVSRHDFGNYYNRLYAIIKECRRCSNKLIIVKLHPFVDGENANNNSFALKIKSEIEKIGKNIKVYEGKSNIHNFIKNSYCVLLSNSGAGFECMMHGKPMITWGFPEYHWISYDLRHLADLYFAINNLKWFNKNKSDKFLYWYMENYNQETCNKRVKELISRI